MFQLDHDQLQQLALQHHRSYVEAEPFPHAVFDGMFADAALDDVLEEFPAPSDPTWGKFDSAVDLKLATEEAWKIPSVASQFLAELNGAAFVRFLATLTGIEGLIPDPHLVGGGLHQIERGGFLKVHADFCWHPDLKLDRRINVLVYLNKDWGEDYGGSLELWDPALEHVRRVAPLFNRTVVFNTTDYSLHGHPDPLTCPPERSRRSMALYYYSNGRPQAEISPDRPHHQATLWTERHGESFHGRGPLHRAARKLLPPILLDGLQSLRNRRGR